MKKIEKLIYKYNESFISLAVFTILSFKNFIHMNVAVGAAEAINRYWSIIGSYQDVGFAPRIIIGSIIRLFINYTDRKFVVFIFIISYFIVYALISLLIYYMLKNKKCTQITSLIIICFIIFFPNSEYYLTNHGLLMHDVFLTLFLLIGIFFTFCKRECIKDISILFMFFSLATSTISAFTTLPILFLCYSYNEIKSNKNKAIRNISLYSIVYILLFLLCSFFKVPKHENALQIAEEVAKHTSYSIDNIEDFVEYTLFENTIEIIKRYFQLLLKADVAVWFSKLFHLPIFIFCVRLCFRCYKQSKEFLLKLFYIFCILSILLQIPSHIIACDWQRWTDSSILLFVIVFIYLIIMNDKLFVDELNKSIKKYYIVIIFYLMLLSCTQHDDSRIYEIDRIIKGLKVIKQKLIK